mgnify:FL=1
MDEINLDNKKIVKKWQILASVFSLIFGTLLHFTYEWSNKNAFIWTFSAVNESTWEHLKLAFFPMLIIGIIEYFFVKNKVNNYIESKTIGITSSILFITSFFYTYTGIIGTNFFIIDIFTFVFAVLIGEYISYKIMNSEEQSTKATKIMSIIILVVLTIYFVLFTFVTPRINYFKDPVNGSYGRKL